MITAKINKDEVSAEVFWSKQKVGTAYRTEPSWGDIEVCEDENWMDDDLAKWCKNKGKYDPDYPPMVQLMDSVLDAIYIAYENDNNPFPEEGVKMRQKNTKIMTLGNLVVALDTYNSPYMRIWAENYHPNIRFDILANGSQILFSRKVFDRAKIDASDMTKYSYLSGDYIVAMIKTRFFGEDIAEFVPSLMAWKKYTPAKKTAQPYSRGIIGRVVKFIKY